MGPGTGRWRLPAGGAPPQVPADTGVDGPATPLTLVPRRQGAPGGAEQPTPRSAGSAGVGAGLFNAIFVLRRKRGSGAASGRSGAFAFPRLPQPEDGEDSAAYAERCEALQADAQGALRHFSALFSKYSRFDDKLLSVQAGSFVLRATSDWAAQNGCQPPAGLDAVADALVSFRNRLLQRFGCSLEPGGTADTLFGHKAAAAAGLLGTPVSILLVPPGTAGWGVGDGRSYWSAELMDTKAGSGSPAVAPEPSAFYVASSLEDVEILICALALGGAAAESFALSCPGPATALRDSAVARGHLGNARSALLSVGSEPLPQDVLTLRGLVWHSSTEDAVWRSVWAEFFVEDFLGVRPLDSVRGTGELPVLLPRAQSMLQLVRCRAASVDMLESLLDSEAAAALGWTTGVTERVRQWGRQKWEQGILKRSVAWLSIVNGAAVPDPTRLQKADDAAWMAARSLLSASNDDSDEEDGGSGGGSKAADGEGADGVEGAAPAAAGSKPKKGKKVKASTLLTPTQKDEIKAAFEAFDEDGSGTMDFDELAVAMKTMGFSPREEDLAALKEEIGEDGSIEVDLFIEIMAEKYNEIASKGAEVTKLQDEVNRKLQKGALSLLGVIRWCNQVLWDGRLPLPYLAVAWNCVWVVYQPLIMANIVNSAQQAASQAMGGSGGNSVPSSESLGFPPPFPEEPTKQLIALVCVSLLGWIVQSLLNKRLYTDMPLGPTWCTRMRHDLVLHLSRLPHLFVESMDSATVMNMLANDVPQARRRSRRAQPGAFAPAVQSGTHCRLSPAQVSDCINGTVQLNYCTIRFFVYLGLLFKLNVTMAAVLVAFIPFNLLVAYLEGYQAR